MVCPQVEVLDTEVQGSVYALESAVVVCRSEPDVVVLEVDEQVDEVVGGTTSVVGGEELDVVEQVDVQEGESGEVPVIESVDVLVVDVVEKIVIQNKVARSASWEEPYQSLQVKMPVSMSSGGAWLPDIGSEVGGETKV